MLRSPESVLSLHSHHTEMHSCMDPRHFPGRVLVPNTAHFRPLYAFCLELGHVIWQLMEQLACHECADWAATMGTWMVVLQEVGGSSALLCVM